MSYLEELTPPLMTITLSVTAFAIRRLLSQLYWDHHYTSPINFVYKEELKTMPEEEIRRKVDSSFVGLPLIAGTAGAIWLIVLLVN